jgi:ABC-type glycerol-3-phosphate transport system substrate-binding protein
MKVKTFEVVLHLLPSGKSPVTALEEQINQFLEQHPDLKVVATHMSSLVMPAEPNAMPRTDEASVVVFCALFYNE